MIKLNVDSQKINYIKINDEDYISITAMLKSKDGEFTIIKSQTRLVIKLVSKSRLLRQIP